MSERENEGIPIEPTGEITPRQIDLGQVIRWLADLETRNRVEDFDDLANIDALSRFQVQANGILEYGEEVDFWDRNEADCSCHGLPESSNGCPENAEIEFKDGTRLPAIPYGQEIRFGDDIEGGSCHDCGCQTNNFHHPGCDMEECPRCGQQAIGCDCLNGYISEEAKNKAFRRDVLASLLSALDDDRHPWPGAETLLSLGAEDDLQRIITETMEYFSEETESLSDDSEITVESVLEALGYFSWLEAKES